MARTRSGYGRAVDERPTEGDRRSGDGGRAAEAGIVDQQDALLHEMEEAGADGAPADEEPVARIVDPADDIYD
jgi:hypothetical protein